MGYLAFQDIGGGACPGQVTPQADATPATRLSALEWSVVALARKDRLASLRPEGTLATALRMLFREPNPVLADARLEALRRMAVLSWRYGYTVPSSEVKAFLTAGFTPRQYETMVDSITAARMREAPTRARRAFRDFRSAPSSATLHPAT